MKRISEFIIEKLKVSDRKLNITAAKFIDAFYKYCEQLDTCEITALDIYGKFNNIPEIYIDDEKTRARINFALRPDVKYGNNTGIAIWEYDKKNTPVEELIFVQDNEGGFEFLKSEIFGEDVLYETYNYLKHYEKN